MISPPTGLGCYARDRVIDSVRWSFVAVNGARTDAPSLAKAARDLGAEVWVYSTPEAFRPNVAPASVRRLGALARSIRARGVIADPEGGWPELSSGARDRAAEETSEALLELKSAGLEIGITSYPLFPARAAFASRLAGHAWASPQIYGRTAQGAATFASWFRPWFDAYRGAAIPSIAGWASHDRMRTQAGAREYLAELPRAVGAIAWLGAGPIPSQIAAALQEYDPAGSAMDRIGLEVSRLARDPVAVSIAVGVLMLVILGGIVAGRRLLR